MGLFKYIVAALATSAVAVSGARPQLFSVMHTDHFDASVSSVQSFHPYAMNQVDSAFNTIRTFGSTTGDGASAQLSESCMNALVGLAQQQTALETCSTSSSKLGSSTDQSVYQQFCAGGCQDLMYNVINTFRTACASDFAADGGDMASFDAIAEMFKKGNGLCVAINGEYCMPKFLANQQAMSSAASQTDQYGMPVKSAATDAQIATMCSDCTQALMKTWSAIGMIGKSSDASAQNNNYARVLDALCVKDNSGNFCYNQVYSTFNNLQRGKESGSDYANMCNPCFRKMIAAIPNDDIRNQTSMELANFTPLCRKDTAGNTCISRVEAFVNFTESADSAQSPCGRNATQPTCNVAACKSSRQAIIDEMGCCFNLMFDMFNANQKPRDRLSDAAISQAMCGIEYKAGCAAPAPVSVNLKFPNVKYSWYTANKATFDAACKKDISKNTGLAEDQITIVGTSTSTAHKMRMMAAASGTQITATMTPDSDADASTVKSAAVSGSYTSSSAAVPDSGKVDTSASTAPTVDGSSASSIVISFSVMIIAALLAVTMQQIA